MSKVENLFDKMNEAYKEADYSPSGEAFSNLSSILENLESGLREYAQEMTMSDVKDVIKKLKNNENLSGSDLELVKSWIVGDAEYYTKMENNYKDWLSEIKRLMSAINSNRSSNPDLHTVHKLKAYIRDAKRTIADAFYYLQQKDRVDRFDQSTQSIDAQEKEILINLLEQQMKSAIF